MKKTNIRVFLVDDHPFLLEGLTLMLDTVPDIEVIGEANDGVELLEKLESLASSEELPDVILMDVGMPKLNGYQTTELVREKYRDINTLMLTILDSDFNVQQAKKVGARGFLSKRIDKGELVKAIRDCLLDTAFIVHNPIKQESMDSKISPTKKEKEFWLTDREKQIIELIAKEQSSETIVQRLRMSPLGFSAARKTILSKLKVKTDAGMVREALSRGLIATRGGQS